MPTASPPLIAMILGWIVILALPSAFFAFGWKDIALDCERATVGALPSCKVSESFAMKLYTRNISADAITHIAYRNSAVGQVSTKNGSVAKSSSRMVFDTHKGEVSIGHITSAIDHSAERELILKVRAFLNSPEAMNFRYEAHLHGMFGYLGLLGVTALLLIFLAVLWHQLRQAFRR